MSRIGSASIACANGIMFGVVGHRGGSWPPKSNPVIEGRNAIRYFCGSARISDSSIRSASNSRDRDSAKRITSDRNQAIAMIGIPWYNVIGNHDTNYDARDDAGSDETFERVYGPSTYAFEYARAHFVDAREHFVVTAPFAVIHPITTQRFGG